MFGGSFNPIHNGHVAVAAAVRERFQLETVLLMVAKDPPHKQIAGSVDGYARLAMANAALAGREGLAASDIELRREGKSYTADTLRALASLYPGAQLSLIVGADMLCDLPNWREPEAICAMAEIIAVGRPKGGDCEAAARALASRYGARVRLSGVCGPELSSTEIRQRVLEALPVDSLMPPGAAWLMYEKGLYQPERIVWMQEKLRATLKYSRYLHCVGAMECAVELAARFGCDAKKARVAALLHDCAKLPEDALIALAKEFGVTPSEYDLRAPGLLHDRVGAFLAQRDYGVEDEEILRAIGRHTLCACGMTKLDKVVYLADKMERTRDYPGVEEIRAAAQSDLERAVVLCMEHVIAHLRRQNHAIDPAIFTARAEISEQLQQKEREDET